MMKKVPPKKPIVQRPVENEGAKDAIKDFLSTRNSVTLDLEGLDLVHLPAIIKRAARRVHELFLPNNCLSSTAFPPEIGLFTNLQELDLSFNRLQVVPPPPMMPLKSSLVKLFLEGNDIHTLTPHIGLFTSLQVLDLSDNRITAIPNTIGNLTNLVDLVLSQNQLTRLPWEIAKLVSLVTLETEANNFTCFPTTVTCLTALKTLACDLTCKADKPSEVKVDLSKGGYRPMTLKDICLTVVSAHPDQVKEAHRVLPQEVIWVLDTEGKICHRCGVIYFGSVGVTGRRSVAFPPESYQIVWLECHICSKCVKRNFTAEKKLEDTERQLLELVAKQSGEDSAALLQEQMKIEESGNNCKLS